MTGKSQSSGTAAVGQDGIVQFDRTVPAFLQETPEASAWFEAFAQRLRNMRCEREEIAWVLGVRQHHISEAVPSSCDAEAFRHLLLSQMTFVPQGSGCIIKDLSGKPYLNGRRATICRDLQVNCPHAVLLVEGGIKEKSDAGDRSKTVMIARTNLQFAAPAKECTMANGFPSLHVLTMSKIAALDKAGADASRPSAKYKPQELLGSNLPKAWPKFLQDPPAQQWLAGVVGRLVDSRHCCHDELVFLLGAPLAAAAAREAASSSTGLGGPHLRSWPASEQVGNMLDSLDFVPTYAVVMVQDSEREELNGRLGEVREPCPPGQLEVRLGMAHDSEDVRLPRKHLRLLPGPGSALNLGFVPFGTRCVVEGSTSRPDLNGRRVMLLEDCPLTKSHGRVFGEGVGELQINRNNLRVVRPDPKVPVETAQDDCRPGLARLARSETIGSLESREEHPTTLRRSTSEVSLIDSELSLPMPAAERPTTAPSSRATLGDRDLASPIGAQSDVGLGGEESKVDTTSEVMPNDDKHDDKGSEKADSINDAKKDVQAEDMDGRNPSKDKAGSETSGGKNREKDVVMIKSTEDVDVVNMDAPEPASPPALPNFAEWFGGLFNWNILACGSNDKGSCATCCRKDNAHEVNVERSGPSIYSNIPGEDPEFVNIHPSLSPVVMGPWNISLGINDVPVFEDVDKLRKEQSDGGLSPSSNTGTREPETGGSGAAETPSSGPGTSLNGNSLTLCNGPPNGPTLTGGEQLHHEGDAEAMIPKERRKGLLNRVLGAKPSMPPVPKLPRMLRRREGAN